MDSYSTGNTDGIKQALKNAGLSVDNIPLYSTDSKWKNGYIVHYEKGGSTTYKEIYASQVSGKKIAWNWWNNGNIPESEFTA